MKDLSITPPHFYRNPSDDNWSARFDDWFDQHVEPLNEILDDAQEIVGYGDARRIWQSESFHDECVTHKALLINIQPIKQETAADVLRDFIEHTHLNSIDIRSYKDRAKKALERD